MEKKVQTASEMVNPELSGGWHSYKEAAYDFLGGFFGWLSIHQGLALILILIVLGIIVWLILRAKKYRIQFKNEAYMKKKEIEKKDALIKEQENKLTNLQKKLSDQQSVVSEALLRTIKTLTGYDADQLPIFFKSLTQISENPLQMADAQAITIPESQLLKAESDNSSGINDSKKDFVLNEDFSEENDAKKENLASDDSPEGAAETNKQDRDNISEQRLG